MTAKIKQTKAGRLNVREYESRALMGVDAARLTAEKIRWLLGEGGEVNMVFAAAPSQAEFLVALRAEKSVEWSRVNAFHMDEYLGLPDAASQRFGNFLKERIFDHLPFCSVHYIQGGA